MPNQTIDELRVGLILDPSKALKQAPISGEKAGKLFAEALNKSVNKNIGGVNRNIPNAKFFKQAIRSTDYGKTTLKRIRAEVRSKKAVSKVYQDNLMGVTAPASQITSSSRKDVGGMLGERLGVALAKPFKMFSEAAVSAAPASERIKKALEGSARAVGRGITAPFKRFSDSIKDAQKRLEKFRSTIARIILYRSIRSLMSAIKKSVQEGIQNLYQYSTVLGTTFAQSMDQISSSALFIKNAFAAMVAPIVDKIAPAIQKIAEYIGNAANEMAEFFTIITKGSNVQYTRAIWFMKKYKETANEAKKALDLLGIDEINRLTDKSGNGSGDDFDKMFEEAVSGEGSSFASAIGEAIRNDDWRSVGEVLAQKLEDAMSYVKSLDIASKIGEKINDAVELANGFLKQSPFTSVASTITDFLKKLEIDWNAVGQAWAAWKTSIFDAILALTQDSEWWGKVGHGIGEFFKGALDHFTEWISGINWEEATTKLFTSIRTFIENVDWEGIKTSLAEFFKAAIRGAGELLKGMFESLVTDVFSIRKGSIADRVLNALGIEHSTYTGALSKEANRAKNLTEIAPGIFQDLNSNAKLKMYASGGYVPNGDLFIANEAGPELVGTMNGRTYVGSNSDINSVGTGIENAVYAIGNMVVQAIERKDTTVSLDGDKLSKAVSNRQNLAALARG